MKKFKKYFDSIQAEEELKEKTVKYIRMYSAKNIEKEAEKKHYGKGIFAMKKLVGTLLSITVLALIALGGFNIYNKPVAFVSFDINPSVELGLNFMNKVVSSKGVNDDGKELLLKTSIKNMSAEDAVQALVQEADKEGYIYKDGSTVIALTALAQKENDAIKIQDRIKDRVESFTKDKNIESIVYADHSNIQLRTEASEYDISPGKYRLIEKLQELDPSITVEQYKDAKVTDIMRKAHDLMGIATKAQATEKNKNMIMDTVQEMMDRNKNQSLKKQDQTITETQQETQQQTQTQIQTNSEKQEQMLNQTQTQNKTQLKQNN